MSASFKDVTIVDLDVGKTTWSRVHSSMRTLYLKLSRDPDQAWTRFFFEERALRVELKRHGLWIEEGYIVFDCLLNDVDSHHLPDFRLSVAYANQQCHELVETQRLLREQTQEDTRIEQQELAALRARIRGDRETNPAATALESRNDAPPADTPPAAHDADASDSEFEARRNDWRSRFRAALALASRKKEPDHGND